MSTDQMLLAFFDDKLEEPEGADDTTAEPAAKPDKKKRSPRNNKLTESLEGLPTETRVIIAPEVLANPELYRLIGTTTSVRLHATPATFTRELIERQLLRPVEP